MMAWACDLSPGNYKVLAWPGLVTDPASQAD